jgi:hypothetical protein
VTHAACFVELLQRRRHMGLSAYACFVDLKKAYNMVPHEAMKAKLCHFGERNGRCRQVLQVPLGGVSSKHHPGLSRQWEICRLHGRFRFGPRSLPEMSFVLCHV